MSSDTTTEQEDQLARCPEPHRLAALLGPAPLPEADASAMAAHLEACDDCRRRLDELAGGADLLEGLSGGDAPADAGATALSEAMAQLRRVPGPPPSQPDHAQDEEALDFLEQGAPAGYLGRFGPYYVIATVGRGGMGIVLKAHDPSLDRVVAIKVLSPALAANANARRRFIREARAAAAVSHEHVVTIHAVDEAGAGGMRLPYLVMQFVGGRSLEARLRATGHLRPEEILRIGMQAAAGLAAAHAQGLVHRDVKPANIMLENGVERVKLTDFGLARAADDAAITLTGQVSGTPHYMSPEQARGERVDHRSDLFSLGSVLYALCTGRPPFGGSSSIGVLRRVCEEEPVPIRERNADIPPWLAEIVASLMRKDPAARPQSASGVAELLGTRLAWLQQPGQQPSSEDVAGWSIRHRTRSPAVTWTLAGAVMSAVAVLAFVALRPAATRINFGRDGATTAPGHPMAPAAAARPVFIVSGERGAARSFGSLAEAASAASPGATIDIDYDGRIETGPLDLGPKPLRIRAAAGKSPVLAQSAGFEPILAASGPLVLEGLHFEAHRGRPDVLPAGEESGPCLVVATGGPLLVTHCRFSVRGAAGMRAGCVRLVNCASCEIRHSELHSLYGMAVQWMEMAEGCSLKFDNVVGAARMVTVAQKAPDRRAVLAVRRSTLFTGALVTAHPAYGPEGLSVELDGDVLVAGAVLFDPEAVRKSGRFEGVAVEFNQTVLERLVSREFDAAVRPAAATVEGARAPESRPPEAAGDEGPGHVEARVRFAGDVRDKAFRGEPPAAEDFALQSVRVVGRGTIPTRRLTAVGARTDTVGTGAAYKAFRESPSYRQWQEEVNARLAREAAVKLRDEALAEPSTSNSPTIK